MNIIILGAGQAQYSPVQSQPSNRPVRHPVLLCSILYSCQAKFAPVKKTATKTKHRHTAAKPKATPKAENLRVPVAILDQLMNRAGELVLARNELLQAVVSSDQKIIAAAGQRIDMVTSELQEAIMLTRMQQVGTIFNKFTKSNSFYFRK